MNIAGSSSELETALLASGVATPCPGQLQELVVGRRQEEDCCQFATAMMAEQGLHDGIKAVLVIQMTVTHAAMTELARRELNTTGCYHVRESFERSMIRLSRTYLAQMEALKKHRAKAQQTVRVERVTVENGGQAVVGNVQHGGRHHGER
ncbi:hypothetical protein [Limimaricola pyoseonensis]|uniref:hypothetical protein n=1 Tax=Limimaricola pyoseonensis TaxID=521013 RepID=UPI0010421DC4|nr:hypothetical protein [Limimaricola pyoseonensis]